MLFCVLDIRVLLFEGFFILLLGHTIQSLMVEQHNILVFYIVTYFPCLYSTSISALYILMRIVTFFTTCISAHLSYYIYCCIYCVHYPNIFPPLQCFHNTISAHHTIVKKSMYSNTILSCTIHTTVTQSIYRNTIL